METVLSSSHVVSRAVSALYGFYVAPVLVSHLTGL